MSHIEIIHWADAVSVDAWTSTSEITPITHHIVSVGLFVDETETVVTLALNHDQDGQSHSCIMHIPKGMILKRKKLRTILKSK